MRVLRCGATSKMGPGHLEFDKPSHRERRIIWAVSMQPEIPLTLPSPARGEEIAYQCDRAARGFPLPRSGPARRPACQAAGRSAGGGEDQVREGLATPVGGEGASKSSRRFMESLDAILGAHWDHEPVWCPAFRRNRGPLDMEFPPEGGTPADEAMLPISSSFSCPRWCDCWSNNSGWPKAPSAARRTAIRPHRSPHP